MAGASRSAILSRVTFHGPKDYLDAARDPATTAAELQSLAECPFVFVHLALAERPDTPLEALRLIVPHEAGGWNENRLLRLLAANPNADATVLRAVGQVIAAFLSTVHPRGHPYGAALALASRPLAPADLLDELVIAPGASHRFRHRLGQTRQAHTT
jgi:hypothetical protein